MTTKDDGVLKDGKDDPEEASAQDLEVQVSTVKVVGIVHFVNQANAAVKGP